MLTLNYILSVQVCIVSGETGSGKSTQVAQFLLDETLEESRASCTYIVVTEPRRISAITLAERVASERAEPLGKSIGYQVGMFSCQYCEFRLYPI